MKRRNILYLLAFGGLGLHILFLSTMKFTAWPEMLLWPYLLTEGYMPYSDVAIAHTPFLILMLAIVFKIFGVGILQLKLFTWILILITDALVYTVANKIWKQKVAVIALISYVFLQTFYDGNGLWFDLLLAPLSLITFYFVNSKKYFMAGIAFALMFITKQTAIWFLIPIGIQIWLRNRKLALSFIKGGAVVFATFLLLLLAAGLIPAFYNWAVNFGIFVLPHASGQIQLPSVKNLIVSLFPFAIFIPLVLIRKMKLKNLTLWAIAGVMGSYPRFEYFHFQPGISFLAFAIAIFFVNLGKRKFFNKNLGLNILITLYLLVALYMALSFAIRNYGEGTRFYEANVQEVVEYVKSNTRPGDKIFVLNWWDNIYPLTDTIPATNPWVPQLSWYQELPGIQDKEVSDLEKNKPKLIIFQRYSDTGLSAYAPQKVYDFIRENYKFGQRIDGIDILLPI